MDTYVFFFVIYERNEKGTSRKREERKGKKNKQTKFAFLLNYIFPYLSNSTRSSAKKRGRTQARKNYYNAHFFYLALALALALAFGRCESFLVERTSASIIITFLSSSFFSVIPTVVRSNAKFFHHQWDFYCDTSEPGVSLPLSDNRYTQLHC